MKDYFVRPATLADSDVLVHHRIGMFTDMGVSVSDEMGDAFREWLAEMIPAGTYRAWLLENAQGEVLAGGGLSILPWPPGPRSNEGRLAFVYNVYTEPNHRRQGLAQLIMNTIHAWCREAGIHAVALNASPFGLSLYRAMGYHEAPSPMMFLGLE